MRRVSARTLRRALNLWPPFLFTGIHVSDIADDFRYARVELRMRPWNRNYVGTHFGGSLFAMTDPFWMLMLLHAVGDDHIVWDRAGAIEFDKPGRGTVAAEFRLDDKVLHWFDTRIHDAAGDVVAHVRKQLYLRRKVDR